MIASAQFQEDQKTIAVVMDDGGTIYVPDDPANRHRRRLTEWEEGGGAITPYVAPKPSDDDLLERKRLAAIDALAEAELRAAADDPDAPQAVKDYFAAKGSVPLRSG